MIDKKIYGFDSFEGLKEDWHGTSQVRGTFNLNANMPKVLSNVELIKGWFHETVPEFLKTNDGWFSFIHFDADTYQTTALLLSLMRYRILKDTIIIFDEYLGYPNWRKGEYLAWQNHIRENNIQYKYLGFSSQQSVIKVI